MTSATEETLKKQQTSSQDDDDDEPDEWDQRILNTGCSDYNAKLLDCHVATKDWRQCVPEMEAFKKCWEAQNNNARTSTKNA
ncbi:similar to Saccharomyces cerevisiae YLR218C COA4 Twin Cx(9)C protein involved in cytochrome c oxidase organization [Geotrichum candidum]|uniref:Similar to Saccharomyces cerevisiae YLR218C COA4 Twin Cx(9)C protein involved in cytochrome c oxidase organization n=1 Tax=Geotrichum candidum TaxID=1173061 RepID=A0A0J9XCT5_GEOCN|nr:similar to Saccharomyces cerevisiae YLR218C COA4 Twin Cx(9)C protein involved in cytochrome c oxidase organization [Geotrichum candidum]